MSGGLNLEYILNLINCERLNVTRLSRGQTGFGQEINGIGVANMVLFCL